MSFEFEYFIFLNYILNKYALINTTGVRGRRKASIEICEPGEEPVLPYDPRGHFQLHHQE